MDILAIGEPLIEFSEIKEPNHGNIYLPGYGGDTSNFVVAAARQGINVGYQTRLGEDTFGDHFIQLWENEGIDTSQIARDSKAHTGIYFISYTENGHQFTYHRKGSAASLITPEDLSEEVIANLRLLHVSGISQAISDSSCDTIFKAVELARRHGVKVAYDPNLRLKLWPLARAKAIIETTALQSDIFLPSLEDAQQLTGMEDPNKIVDYYLDKGVPLIALKLGKDGVIVSTSEERHHVEGFKVKTVDATGAGDTFDGAFVTQVLKGVSLPKAAQYANAAAALSTTGKGAVVPIPSENQVTAFLHEN